MTAADGVKSRATSQRSNYWCRESKAISDVCIDQTCSICFPTFPVIGNFSLPSRTSISSYLSRQELSNTVSIKSKATCGEAARCARLKRMCGFAQVATIISARIIGTNAERIAKMSWDLVASLTKRSINVLPNSSSYAWRSPPTARNKRNSIRMT